MGRRFFKHCLFGITSLPSPRSIFSGRMLHDGFLSSSLVYCGKRGSSLPSSCFFGVRVFSTSVVSSLRRAPFFLHHVCCVLRFMSFVACMLACHVVGRAHASCGGLSVVPFVRFLSLPFAVSLFVSLSLSLSLLCSSLSPQPLRTSRKQKV